MFLQRLKALSDGENEATFLHWTLWRFTIRLLLRSAATTNICIYTVNSIQTGKCLGQKFSAEDCFECRVIKAHICFVYSQTLEINLKR